jgi:RAB protein geranylgeranyltransferase component A
VYNFRYRFLFQEEKRKKMEEAQKKAEHGRILTKQYKAQMRRKSQQIQEALVRTTCICLHVKYP